MQLVEQYIRLCAGCSKASLGQPQDVALADVAANLFCTLRNATLTIKKMQSQGWLVWQPGRGRGNRSVLTCLLAPADVVLSVAKELVQKGEIRNARELIEQYQEQWPALAEEFSRWMSSQFGLHVTREKGNRRVDTLRLFFDRPFHGLDPIHVLLRSQTHLAKQLFDCLVRFDPETKRIEPHLSFYWETDESGTKWTFFLRKGVLFHHGRELTAEDVCYSLLRLKEEQSKHRWLTASIASVIALEEHIVVITLDEPDELFLHALSKEYVAIVPRDYVEEMGERFAQMPVGTGPFRVVRNDDSMLVLEAFQPYFGGRPFLDRIEIWCVPELPEEAKIERGPDHTKLLLAVTSAWRQLEISEMAWQGFTGQEQCFQYVSLNGAKEGPLRDPAFRKRLAQIISPAQLRKDLKGSREKAFVWGADGPFYEREEVLDSSAVEAELKRCGYQGETLFLYTYPDEDHVEDAEWIKETCEQVGIRIQIVYADPNELARPALLGSADLVVDSANVDERSELSLREFLQADALSISHHLTSDQKGEVNQVIRKMGKTKTERERQEYMTIMMEVLAEMDVFVPLYSNRIEMLAHPRLSGVSLDAYGWIDFSRLFVRA